MFEWCSGGSLLLPVWNGISKNRPPQFWVTLSNSGNSIFWLIKIWNDIQSDCRDFQKNIKILLVQSIKTFKIILDPIKSSHLIQLLIPRGWKQLIFCVGDCCWCGCCCCCRCFLSLFVEVLFVIIYLSYCCICIFLKSYPYLLSLFVFIYCFWCCN